MNNQQPVSPERAIENLIARYAFLVDDGDFAGLGALLDDAEFRLGTTVARGKDEVQQLARTALQTYADGTPRTRHVTTNIIIDVAPDGRTATSRAYYTVFQQTGDFPLQAIASGRYEDCFDRRGDTWRFTFRQVSAGLVGDVSHHRKPAPAAAGPA
jgi:3-phenylpropionate/cinnamic acid dioxygenase small subunit